MSTMSLIEQYQTREPKARCDGCVHFLDVFLHNLGDTGYPFIKGLCRAGIRKETANLWFACDEMYTPIPLSERTNGAEERIALYENRTKTQTPKEEPVSTQTTILSTDEAAELFQEAASGSRHTNQDIIDRMALVKPGEAIVVPVENEDEANKVRKRMGYWAMYAGWRKEGERGTYRTVYLNGGGEHRVAVLRRR